MEASGKFSVTLTADQRRRVWEIVESGDFDTPGAVLREALRAWLEAREDGERLRPMPRSFARKRHRPPTPEPFERVDLLFDAHDAKA